MKNSISKEKKIGLAAFGFMVIVFCLGLIVLFRPTAIVNLNIFEIIPSNDVPMKFGIFSCIYLIAVFIGGLLSLFTVIEIFKNKIAFSFFNAFFNLTIQIFAILYHISFGNVFDATSLAFIILNIVLSILVIVLCVIRNITIKNSDSNVIAKQKALADDTTPVVLKTLILCIVSLLLLVSIFFLPLYTTTTKEVINYHTLISTLSTNADDILDTIYLFSFIVFYLVGFYLFIYSISSYFYDKKLFIKKSRTIIYYNFALSIVYFLAGTITSIVYELDGTVSYSYAFIPMILVSITCIFFSIIAGKYDFSTPKKTYVRNSKKYPRVETLIYIILFTSITALSLFLNIIKVSESLGTFSKEVILSGFDLLADYQTLGGGFQVVAFYLIIMLTISGFGLLITLVSFLSKSQYFGKIAKIVGYTNVVLMFLIGISGFYFSIAQEMNIDSIKSLLAFYGYTYDGNAKYVISTDAIYAFIADAILLSLVIIRHAFESSNTQLAPLTSGANGSSVSSIAQGSSNGSEEASGSSASGEVGDGLPDYFDPCPAFTELDQNVDLYNKDLETRQQVAAFNPSLQTLVQYVVNYAKNSRLHLSYTDKDIATFVSGLGASKLTILQGMSGTGKTSLPKIFAEAIDGNCNIVEVESSWKDKNELMGYYNEFSSMYTPRKFTQALYKASLNKDIVTLIVLDEMNLSRIEYYFSDFLSLMENEEDKRSIKLLNVELMKKADGKKIPYKSLINGNTLQIPSNVWFIGTANRDESTFVISDKVYDRANTMNFNKRAPKVRDFGNQLPAKFYSYRAFADLLKQAIASGSFDAEKSETISEVEELLRPYNISFGNRILKQIEDFVDVYQACFPNENVTDEAVETILLSKVVSKLEVKTIEDKEGLIKGFEELHLTKCCEFISKLNED
jgi:GTPase subunit of restriction endonuclease